jgi:hypothetical protein
MPRSAACTLWQRTISSATFAWFFASHARHAAGVRKLVGDSASRAVLGIVVLALL